MSQQKYDPPAGGPPPPAYGSEAGSNFQSPVPAHIAPQGTGQQSDYYGASPRQNYSQPGFPQGQGPYAQQGGYQQQQGGYYQQDQQMGYAPQGQYGPQGGYGQGGYPQGQHVDQRGKGGVTGGLLGGCLAAMACCCCLDCLF